LEVGCYVERGMEDESPGSKVVEYLGANRKLSDNGKEEKIRRVETKQH